MSPATVWQVEVFDPRTQELTAVVQARSGCAVCRVREAQPRGRRAGRAAPRCPAPPTDHRNPLTDRLRDLGPDLFTRKQKKNITSNILIYVWNTK